MPQAKLEEIINNFKIEDLANFFRLKTQAQGNFRSINEKLPQYNDDFFSNFCKLGQIEFSATEKLIVVGAEVKKNLSERSGKKYQYEKAKKILKELAVYSAGIFIFYDSNGSFRFSLVYPEAAGSRREWSNFRRFTYFVSKEFTNKTFLSQIGDGDFSSLAKIKDAFSVEKVTKEFYLEYRKLFESILNELSKNYTFKNEASKNNINPENFAKKLLGQIVFLFFIQKKGWLGVSSGNKWGEGNKNFMGDLFKEAMKKKVNFFNDYLEKLFYNALNNPRRNSTDQSFSKDFNCRIPFLNGGLFEAEYNWEDSLMYLDNNIFKAIFDVFERYNFTVEEESPDDKEVAVDPEMLGKVFENLLSENLRKGKGTYYTPREIVYYMCREALINYLVSNHSNIVEESIRDFFYSESFENFKQQKGESFTPGQWKELDDLLKNIKVCDPACGSGAFLVGMLNLIVKLRIYLQTTPDFYSTPQKTEYELKKETIQNCIYGVDIDPGAIEIAKLRLWLSLVVDYSIEDIEPLPNLDYHLMCGNSLLEEYEGVKFYNGENSAPQTSLPIDTDKQKKVAKLEKKIKEYFDIHDDKEKQAKRKEINDIKDWLVRSALEKRKYDLAVQRKNEEAKANMLNKNSREQYLASWSDKFLAEEKIKEVLDNLHNPKAAKPFFIWRLEFIDVFQEKGGFDIVIGNPPYIQLQKSISEENLNKYADLYKNENYQTFDRMGDIYCLFYEKGINLLKNGGYLAFITSNKWMRAKYGEKLRSFFLNCNPKVLIDLGPNVFESSIVDTSILIIQKLPNQNQLRAVKVENNKKSNVNIEEIVENEAVVLTNLSKDAWFIGNNAEQKLKEKIERIGKPLKEWDVKIYRGILTGFNEAFIIDSAKREEILNNCKDENERKRTEAIIKPILRGRDIKRYYYEWAGLWVIFIPWHFPLHKNKFIQGASKEAEKEFNKQYPCLYNYLLKYKEALSKRNKEETGIRYEWYALQRCAASYYSEFEKEKIVYGQFQNNAEYALAEKGVYLSSNEYMIGGNYNKKYFLACLNSNLTKWFLKNITGTLGNNLTIGQKSNFLNFPIPIITGSNKLIVQQIETFVDEILAIAKDEDYSQNSEKQAKVKEYEKQIDQLVYKLYDLTQEEIKIVESAQS